MVQMTPSSPVHQGAPVGLAQKRLMREAEPANSGHSGHTPKAQHVQEPLDINAQSAWEMHHRQVCILLSTCCCCKGACGSIFQESDGWRQARIYLLPVLAAPDDMARRISQGHSDAHVCTESSPV